MVKDTNVDGVKNEMEKAEGSRGRKPSVEGVIVDFLIKNDLGVTTDEECLQYARRELGDGLPADRVALALGYISFGSLIHYSPSTGRVEVDSERRQSFLESRNRSRS